MSWSTIAVPSSLTGNENPKAQHGGQTSKLLLAGSQVFPVNSDA